MTSIAMNTAVDSLTLSPNPIDSQEAFLIDVQAHSKGTWGEYSSDTWSSVSSLTWG